MADPVRAIAERLAEQLRIGQAPWQRIWNPGTGNLPLNPATGQVYHAVNAVSLASAAIEAGWTDPRWMTAAQAAKLDASVRPGERPSLVIAWQFGQRMQDGSTVRLEQPRMTVREVYNAEQLDGLPDYQPGIVQPDAALARVGAIARGSKAGIVTDANGGPSRYDPERDTILMKGRSDGKAGRYAQIELIHALAHWTAHPDRLNRDVTHPIGSIEHAREELRTNIASLFLGDRLGIGWHPGTHAALGNQWAAMLVKDPTEVLRATKAAETIAQQIIGFEMEREQDIEQQRETLVARDHPALAQPAPERRSFLVVPFAEKNQAKTLGARFDRTSKAWYIPQDLDPVPFAAWLPNQAAIRTVDDADPRLVFAGRLRQAGFILGPRDPIFDGQIHHSPVDGNTGKEQSGSYRVYGDGVPNGWLQNFRIHDKPEKWVHRSSQAQAVTPEVRETIKALSAQAKQDAALAQQSAYNAAAAGYQKLWDAAVVENVAQHPYLTRKGITAADGLRIAGPDATMMVKRQRTSSQAAEPWMMKTGGLAKLDVQLKESAERSYERWSEAKPELARLHGIADYVQYVQEKWAEEQKPDRLVEISIAGRLLIPMRNTAGELRSLQVIDDQGGKMFAPGGEVIGSHFVLGDINSPWPLHFDEGFATGDAIHDATGHAVVVAFTSGNLAPVAAAYRERMPDRTFLFDADNDHRKPRELDAQGRPKRNVGKERAEAAAELVNGFVLLPPFAEQDAGNDWDDYRRQHGIEALRLELTGQMAAASRMQIARGIEVERTRENTHTREREREKEQTG